MSAHVLDGGLDAAPATPAWISAPDATPTEASEPPESCAYVDADVWSWQRLAATHEVLARRPPLASSRTFVLHTCERIEIYGTDSAALTPVLGAIPGGIAHRIEGREYVRRRLTEIAAGLRSRLLGERLVWRQVERVGTRLDDGHALLGVLREALEIARVARERHRFFADVDYPDLAGALLPPAERDRGGLLVVGSGMLARAVVRQARTAGHRPIVMVSRQPKHARRRAPFPPPEVLTSGVSSARGLLGLRPYGVVLATTNMTGPYLEHVAALARNPRCLGVVDLCSTPAQLDDVGGPPYVHLHSPAFIALVRRQNDELTDRASLVRRDIAEAYGGRR